VGKGESSLPLERPRHMRRENVTMDF